MRGKHLRLFDSKLNIQLKVTAVRFSFDLFFVVFFLSLVYLPFCGDQLLFDRFVRINFIPRSGGLSIEEQTTEENGFSQEILFVPVTQPLLIQMASDSFDSLHYCAVIMINSIRFDAIGCRDVISALYLLQEIPLAQSHRQRRPDTSMCKEFTKVLNGVAI